MSRVQQTLEKLSRAHNLTQEEAGAAMEEIMTGQATNSQIAAFIMGLRMKGETAEEIAGCALVMRDKATPIITRHQHVVDTCGTGGDCAMTFNISTTVAFVLAGAGIPVAKHGNRSVSSKSGSADVLEALGVNLEISAKQVGNSLDELGIGFLFAPALHGAMKYAAAPRKELGIRTIFNILGPLTNPAKAQGQVLGVFDPQLTEIMAQVLLRMGTKEAFVLHGHQGLDEISLSGPSKVTRLHNGSLETFSLNPEDYGLQRVDNSALVGGTAEHNATITLKVLQGQLGPARDVVLINAALGIMSGNGAEDIREGLEMAARSIDSGAALGKLEELIAFSRQVA